MQESDEGRGENRIAVVIPAYKVKRHLEDLFARIPSYVWQIYLIDDACPENSGAFAEKHIRDTRLRVLYHKVNCGVGGAVMTGYRQAIADGATVIVKIDGDGQMDPKLIPYFIQPILDGQADYTKGNRFLDIEKVKKMPKVRLMGNATLSFMSKFSTGYWKIFDPTNGYTAIHTSVAALLPFEKISERYFFESDMLFRLNTFQAVVVDIPMEAVYADEQSNLKIKKIVFEFFCKHMRNYFKRIFYNYYLRDMSAASVELLVGMLMIIFGVYYGVSNWIYSMQYDILTPTGTIMLSTLPIILGVQLLLSFLNADMSTPFKQPLHARLRKKDAFPVENDAFNKTQ